MARRVNRDTIDMIKRFEGLRLKAYLCPAGVPTIGYGHTKGVFLGDQITEDQAEQLLQEDLREVEKYVEKAVKVPLNDNEFGALVSFAFNVGVGAFGKSTLLKVLNSGDKNSVPSKLKEWVHSKGVKLQGLVRRRDAEAKLWNTPVTTGVYSLNDYQILAATTATYDSGSMSMNLAYLVLKLCGESGEVAEKLGKRWFHGQQNVSYEALRNELLPELGDVLWYVAVLAKELDITLQEIAEMNLQKLDSRAARGVILGDGDAR